MAIASQSQWIERAGVLVAFNCVSRTDVGLRRKVNEDSIMVRTERGLWAVADGMGGHEAGDVASAKVADALSGCRSSTVLMSSPRPRSARSSGSTKS